MTREQRRQQADTIKNIVNLHRESLQLEQDQQNPDHHLVSFVFDSLTDGKYISYHYRDGHGR